MRQSAVRILSFSVVPISFGRSGVCSTFLSRIRISAFISVSVVSWFGLTTIDCPFISLKTEWLRDCKNLDASFNKEITTLIYKGLCFKLVISLILKAGTRNTSIMLARASGSRTMMTIEDNSCHSGSRMVPSSSVIATMHTWLYWYLGCWCWFPELRLVNILLLFEFSASLISKQSGRLMTNHCYWRSLKTKSWSALVIIVSGW